MTIRYKDNTPITETSLDRDDVMACDNIDTLMNWFNDLEESADSLLGQIESRIATETDDDSWLIRASDKLGYTRRGQSVVRRRLRELGVEVFVGDAERGMLKQKVQELKAQVMRDGLFISAVKDTLDPDTLHRIRRSVKAKLNSRIEKVRQDNEQYIERLKDMGDLLTA